MTGLTGRLAVCIVTTAGLLAATHLSRAQVPPSIRAVPPAPAVQPLQPATPITPSTRLPSVITQPTQPIPGSALPARGPADGQTDPGFAGPDQPRPTGPTGPRPGLAIFDPAPTFVPPSQLGIVDRYVKEQAITSPEMAREELSTITVTPDGRVESTSPKSEDVEILIRGLQNIEFAPQRPRSLQESDQQNLGVDEAGGNVQAESVIGQDTRTQVTATTAYPYRVIGRIGIGCTGTLVGPRHVLTAGHCVYNINTDKWYSALDFTPGQSGSAANQKPYGTIAWSRAISVKGWTQSHLRDYDYAMIVLNQDIGNSNGWLGYGWQNPMPSYNVNINGYPADKPLGTMWHAYCQFQIIQTFRLYYACDTFGGMSGSAVYLYKTADQSRIIYGIHAYGVDSTGLNGATRITQSVFNKIKEWKQTY